MLNSRPDRPSVGLDEVVALNVEVNGRHRVGAQRLDSLVHLVNATDSNGLRVLIADSVRKRNGKASSLLGQPVELLLDLLSPARINGVDSHALYPFLFCALLPLSGVW